jgi:hypothetical protein
LAATNEILSGTLSFGKFPISTMFELCVWHPLALPADKQNRAGYRSLSGGSWAYPSNVTRSDREAALSAIRAFRNEMQSLVSALPEGESDLSEVGAALHTQLFLSPRTGPRIANALVDTAQRHGLACYDPQNDTLTLPILSDPARQIIVSPDENPVVAVGPAMVSTVGPWVIRAYPDFTRQCYAAIEEGGSNRCGCDNCKNFALVRDRAYPPEMLAAIESFGIDYRKESEVHYYGKATAGLHTYRGWFYVAGSIEKGPNSWYCPPNGKPERRFYRISPGFEVGLGRKSDYGFSEWETVLLDAGFAEGPCLEVDFYVDLPWVSDAPEPEAQSTR